MTAGAVQGFRSTASETTAIARSPLSGTRSTFVPRGGIELVALEPDLAAQARLVRELCAPGVLGPHGARVIETHISFVLLTGSHAYKIKKAVRLPFLDFSSLAARHRYCCDELRLNRRLAPGIYLDVVAIGTSGTGPRLDGPGPAVEYAVRMREFAQDALLSSVLARNELKAAHVDALAAEVAAFHRTAPGAAGTSPHGLPERVLRLALDNFAIIGPHAGEDRATVAALEGWTRAEHATRLDALAQRHATGAIRECHGDLHLANVVLADGEPTMFDCIEFSEEMRWIDPMSEIAFTAMDLEHRGRPDLAHRFVSAYLESSGDYAGCAILRYYLVYRAMVRAKVACLRAAQLPAGDDRTAARRELGQYLRLATRYTAAAQRTLAVMHGPSGCGKSTLALALVESTGAIRVRTDAERKRLAGLARNAHSGAALDAGPYAADMTRQTYEHVLSCAQSIIAGGFIALVDGAFLQKWQRDLARERAVAEGVAFVVVDCRAAPAVLQARVVARATGGDDISEAGTEVLAHQLQSEQPLDADELRYTIACRTDGSNFGGTPTGIWRRVVERITMPAPPPARPGPAAAVDASLAAKVQLLSHPDTYDGTMTVEPVETHASWVFLTEHEAWKLKKPVFNRYVDLRTPEGRERNGIEELRVNRRFTADVYLGVVPLRRDAAGALCVDGDGDAVDWLVRMRRLPAELMLDRVIATRRFNPCSLDGVVRLLARVYRETGPVTVAGDDYRRHLQDAIAEHERDLLRADARLAQPMVREIIDWQRAFVRDTAWLVDRVRAFRIVEGHGDLRPEHICLERDPKIIDSLEFARALRVVDAADELGFLALECERLGAPEAREVIFETYGELTGDHPPAALVDFYQSMRACTRAMLAVRHLGDDSVRDEDRWRARARRYLELALLHAGIDPSGHHKDAHP
ncbi:MAG TPA: AAA family ATPase [Casimicrobiaceae bacterium]